MKKSELESAFITISFMLAIFVGICLSMVAITIISAIVDWITK